MDYDYILQSPTSPALPLTNKGFAKDMCGKDGSVPMGKFFIRRHYVQGRSSSLAISSILTRTSNSTGGR